MSTNVKKTTSKTTRLLIVLLAIVSVALISVIVVLLIPNSDSNHPEVNDSTNTIPTVTVETPYCNLKYPEKWKDQMTVSESTEEGIFKKTFYAVIDGLNYELYTVYFGGSEKGDFYGYIPYKGQNISVYIECHSLPEENSLQGDERILFYSMMEGVNEVAKSIAATEGYFKP